LAQHFLGADFLFRITVKEAKATYEAQLLESGGISMAKSGDLTMTHFNFNIGAITPDWKHSRTSHTDKMDGHSIGNVSFIGSLTTEEYVRRLQRATTMFGRIKVQRGHKDELNSLTKSVEDGDFLIYLFGNIWMDFSGLLYKYEDGQWYILTDTDGWVQLLDPALILGCSNPNPCDNSDNGNDNNLSDSAGPPTKLNLTNMRYPGYVAGIRDYFQHTKEIVAQFGVKPGSYYITMFLANAANQLVPVGDQNTYKALIYIQDCINRGIPVIVGVDYHPGTIGVNNGTVDHWVVVYGYGYDSNGDPMLWYIDTNRGEVHASEAYEDNLHQFSYDANSDIFSAPRIGTDHRPSDSTYNMTVVREMNPL